jgi:hypothetical protein
MEEWIYRSPFSWPRHSWRWVVRFTPRSLYPRGNRPCTHCVGGWVGPRDGPDDMVKWKFLILPGLELQPLDRPARSLSLYRLRYRESHTPTGGSEFLKMSLNETQIYIYNIMEDMCKVFSYLAASQTWGLKLLVLYLDSRNKDILRPVVILKDAL